MSTSIRATNYGVEFREGNRRVRLYKHQLATVADYLVDHMERLEQAAEQENE